MYFIHIRKEKDSPITLEEWKSAIATDPEMSFDNTTTYTSPTGEDITKSGGFYGIWKVPTIEDTRVAFWLEDGEIHAVFDTLTLQKAYSISRKLNGVVYGDMGEEY